MEKRKRLAVLKGVLETETMKDQAELRRRLKQRGYGISQASLSRDLRELGVQKVRREDGSFAYVLPEAKPPAYSAENLAKRFSASVTSVTRSSVIVLVRTPPGEASLVGRLLDASGLEGLLGTVAGDDTIICVADTGRNAGKLERKMKEWVA